MWMWSKFEKPLCAKIRHDSCRLLRPANHGSISAKTHVSKKEDSHSVWHRLYRQNHRSSNDFCHPQVCQSSGSILPERREMIYLYNLSRPGIGQRFFVHPYDFTTLKKWKVSAMVLAPTSNHPRMTPSFGRRCSPWQSDARLLIDLSARTYIMESVGPWACEKIVAIKLKHMW